MSNQMSFTDKYFDKFMVAFFFLVIIVILVLFAFKLPGEPFKWAVEAFGLFFGLFSGLITGYYVGKAQAANTPAPITPLAPIATPMAATFPTQPPPPAAEPNALELGAAIRSAGLTGDKPWSPAPPQMRQP
jgi:membrane-bound metal-dependent hydrolase YbcI (DUF457 family)